MELEMTREDKIHYDHALIAARRAEASGFIATARAFREIAVMIRTKASHNTEVRWHIAS